MYEQLGYCCAATADNDARDSPNGNAKAAASAQPLSAENKRTQTDEEWCKRLPPSREAKNTSKKEAYNGKKQKWSI